MHPPTDRIRSKRMGTPRRSWGTLTLCALLSAAGAQELPSKPLEEVVVTASELGPAPAVDSASAGVIGGEQLAARPLQRTGELLEAVPGLIVTQHSGDGKANQYFLRGFDLDHGTDFATAVDGVPVNLPTHAHGQGYTDLNFLIPELVEELSYRKGPYYADVGDFAAAGSADIRLLRRLEQSRVTLEGGEYGYARALAAGSFRLGAGELLIGVQAQHHDGPWVLPEDYRAGTALISYAAGDRAAGFAVESILYGGRWRATDQIPLRAVQAGLIPRFGYVDPGDGGVTHRYSLSAEGWREVGSGELRANLYTVDYFVDLFSDFTYFLDPLHGDQFEQYDHRHVFGGELRWQQPLAAANVTGMLSAGLQARVDDIDPVALYDTTAGARWRTVSTARVTEQHYAGYLTYATPLASFARLELGARLDAFRFDVAVTPAASSGVRSTALASPKASLVLGPWGDTEYFVNFGRGFHSNDARGVVLGTDSAARATAVARALGAELGVRSRPVPQLELSGALWTLLLDSELTLDADAGSIEPGPATRRYGIELAARYRPVTRVLFDAELALTHARYREEQPNGQFLPNSLPRVAALGVTLNGDTGCFGAAQLRYLGAAPITQDGTVRTHSSLRVSLQGGYHFGPQLTATVSIYNLFNRPDDDIAYYYASQLRTESAPVDDIHFHPAEPRQVRASLSWRW